MEEAQGSDVQGRSIIIDFTGEKSQKGSRGELRCCLGPVCPVLLWTRSVVDEC